MTVGNWIMSRLDGPYRGMERAAGFPNLWFGPVPGTEDQLGYVVTCTYWIEERRQAIRCDNFTTLGLPL